eukprot:scaffold653_cov78-Skeletonema_dohrnii-CCMP3373.AAC.2
MDAEFFKYCCVEDACRTRFPFDAYLLESSITEREVNLTCRLCKFKSRANKLSDTIKKCPKSVSCLTNGT